MWGNQSYPYSNLGRWKWHCKGNETTLSTDILLSNYWGTREQFVQVSPHFQEVSCNIRRFFLKPGRGFKHLFIPICSMHGRCTYIYHKFKVNVGTSSYSIWDIYPWNWKPPILRNKQKTTEALADSLPAPTLASCPCLAPIFGFTGGMEYSVRRLESADGFCWRSFERWAKYLAMRVDLKVDFGLGELNDDCPGWRLFAKTPVILTAFAYRNLRVANAVPSTFAPDGSSSFEALGSVAKHLWGVILKVADFSPS